MTKLLVVETSPRGDSSISRNMTRHFVAHWQAAHPDSEIVERDLAKTDLAFITAPWLQAYFTPPGEQSAEMKEALHLSDELVAELLAADEIVISTPVHNYNIPASLKAWVDYIVRKGMTLGFDGKGMVSGKKATVLLASGGVYTEGSPIRDRDIARHYLNLILSVIGITDVTIIAGGGAKVVDLGEESMNSFIGKLDSSLKQAAA
ncbi:FMN-dependent NADH-azoreductase 1 [Alloalcanivorax dieselolei]|nr:NAD(P)H-dependent oxidoreductase [Alloalcanivorax dieselolei]GGK00626.1 FMN-dependent NADH-azoreductase 1 [Alloalcanivorax dieselolei]